MSILSKIGLVALAYHGYKLATSPTGSAYIGKLRASLPSRQPIAGLGCGCTGVSGLSRRRRRKSRRSRR
jgi:hypothetical protein